MSDSKFTLKLIEREIERLETQSSATGLSLNDVKALEILIRTGQSLISQPLPDAEEAEDQKPSDQQIIDALKKQE